MKKGEAKYRCRRNKKNCKKFAVVTEYGEIDDNRIVKDVRDGRISIYQAFDIENGTRNCSFEERLFDTLEEAKEELAKLKTKAIVRKGVIYFLDCEVSYIEERDYDEDGEYDMTKGSCGNVWDTAKEEIKEY